MLLSHAIAKSIKTYPSLYRDVTYERSRLKVLNQLFLVGGSGLCWYDGYRAETEEMTKREFDMKRGGWVGLKGPRYGKRTFDDTFEPDYWTRRLSPKWDPNNRIIVLIKAKGLYDEADWDECARYDFRPYPQSESDLWMPDLIQPDWLAGFREVVDAALAYYEAGGKGMHASQPGVTPEQLAKVVAEQLRLLGLMRAKLATYL